MDNSEKYQILAERETGVPSCMAILPFDSDFIFDKNKIKEQLSRNNEFTLRNFKEEDESTISALIEYKGEEFDVDFHIISTQNIELKEYGFANQITEAELAAAQKQAFLLEVSMFFGKDALNSFHLQLKIMNSIVPVSSVAIDSVSFRLLSGKWLQMTAKSTIPPSPNYLYTIHGVYDDKGNQNQYWLHTHGLIRCGTPELEILNISDGYQQMNDLLQRVVDKFIKDPAKENEKFQIGYDGMGINMAWLRWEEALKDLPSDILGGLENRSGENNVHAEPSGILFAVEENNLISPQIYTKTLSDNPIFYISTDETNRMSALAKERFASFKNVFDKYGNGNRSDKKSFLKKLFSKKDQQQWRFMVKLGLTVDNAEEETEREHLWFDVLSINENTIEGELINQPYWIASLKQGDIHKYPIDLLTDWLIYGPENNYTSDSIYQLEYN